MISSTPLPVRSPVATRTPPWKVFPYGANCDNTTPLFSSSTVTNSGVFGLLPGPRTITLGETGTTLPLVPNSRPPLKPGPPFGGGQTFSIELVSIVTAPVCAKALPFRIVAVVLRVMLASARIFPSNEVLVPSVAEVPTCQNTPSSEPPFEPKLIT